MSEIYETAVNSSRTISAMGTRAKERLLAQVKQEPAKTFSIILAGSVLIALLAGYRISRIQEESRRQRLLEDWMQEVTNWIGRHGRKIAAPIRGSLEATKSAVEEVANSGARAGRQVHPFFEDLKRSFLHLF